MRKWLIRCHWISKSLSKSEICLLLVCLGLNNCLGRVKTKSLSKIEICLLLVCLGLNNCLGRVKTPNFCLGNGHWRVNLHFFFATLAYLDMDIWSMNSK